MSNVTLEKTLDVNIMMLETDRIEVVQGNIMFTMLTTAADDSEQSMQEARIDHSVNFAKCLTFLELMLDHSLLIPANLEQSFISELAPYNNNLISLPDVNETCLLAALHCKLNTICGPNTQVRVMKFTDTVQGLSYIYDPDPELDSTYPELPSTQQEWLGDLPYWDMAWWHREDISTLDRNAFDQDEMDVWIEAKTEADMDNANMSIFDNIERTVREASQENSEPSGELIEVDFKQQTPWKPKFV